MTFRLIAALALAVLSFGSARAADIAILNVSYDPTRELYQEIDEAFIAHWRADHGQTVAIRQSHDGSGKQARKVIDGLDADVVTLGLAYDIDVIAEKAGLLPRDWQQRLPHHSTPFSSTIVFLVRAGNPKGITDWADLVKDQVAVITPNPKTSGGARWNYLAAWGWALKANGGDAEKAKAYVRALYQHVPVLDTGARGATVTFVERGIGDVLLAWESEALTVRAEQPNAFQVVMPSLSIRAEPPVAVVDQVVRKHGTEAVAKAYLEFLFSDEGQRIGAKHWYRPTSEAIAKESSERFADIELFGIDDVFGGWSTAQKVHFGDGGTFDQISVKR
jgi:sulfate transport system substrate-binding protein